MRRAAPLVLLLLVAGCTGDPPRDGIVVPSGSTTPQATASPTTPGAPGQAAPGNEVDALVGRWETDVATLSPASGDVVCTGPVVFELDADGGFAARSQPRCTRRGAVVTASTEWSGTWQATTGVLTVDGDPGDVDLTVDGTAAPLGPLQDLMRALTTSVPYSVEGDVLTLGPAPDDGTRQSVELRRAG